MAGGRARHVDPRADAAVTEPRDDRGGSGSRPHPSEAVTDEQPPVHGFDPRARRAGTEEGGQTGPVRTRAAGLFGARRHPGPAGESAPAPATDDTLERLDEAGSRRRRLVLHGTPPTDPMPMVDLLRRTPYRNAQIQSGLREDAQVREVLDLAARVGELMLRCGAGAPQVEGSVAAIAAAGGLNVLEVDITMQSLLLQSSMRDGARHTQLRVVRSSRTDYARLVAIHELVDDLVDGDLDIGGAAKELRRIKRRRRVWSSSAVDIATGGMASAVALMIGASGLTALITLVVVLLVQLSRSRVGSFRLPDFYGNAIAAFVATVLAWIAYIAGATGLIAIGGNDFAFIVAGGIVAMLPGRTMASAVEDVLSGYPTTGAGRMFATGISLAGLVIGIAFGISVTLRVTTLFKAGFVSPNVLDLQPSAASWPLVVIGAFFIGATGAVTQQSRLRVIVPVAVLCLIGAGVSTLLVQAVGIGAITSSGLAAMLVGFLGRFAANRLRAPAMVIVAPATFGLLPGLTIFRGLYELVGQPDPGTLAIQNGFTTLSSAVAILLAIATGTTFGEILASPWDRTMALRATRRIRG